METLKMEEPKKFIVKYTAPVSENTHQLVKKDIENFLTGDKSVYFLPCCVSSVLVFDSDMNLLYEIKNDGEL